MVRVSGGAWMLRHREPPNACLRHQTMGAKSTTLLQLFLAERGKIIRLIGRIVGCRATAEDLAQDVFVKLWGRRVTGQDRSLLFRTAQNMAIDHVRAQRVRAGYAQMTMPDRALAKTLAPDTAAAARQEIDVLLQALRILPERTQRVFFLNRLDGLSYAEIAKALGVSVSTIEKEMIWALHTCRRCLASDRSR
jgi:RNA polymerase sigma factor (sigma-70 family)